jgi:hypothetical protein
MLGENFLLVTELTDMIAANALRIKIGIQCIRCINLPNPPCHLLWDFELALYFFCAAIVS